MSARLNTGIFGGTFNPFHNGHLAISKVVIEKQLVDELWLMVTPLNPWKRELNALSNEKRLSMVSEAITGIQSTKASDFEFSLPVPSFTANTLRELNKAHTDRDFTLIIGADNWSEFDKWRDYEFILNNFDIIVYPRDGYPIGDLPDRVRVLESSLVTVSSTEIIQRLKKNLPIEHLVPETIAKTIYSEGLFKN